MVYSISSNFQRKFPDESMARGVSYRPSSSEKGKLVKIAQQSLIEKGETQHNLPESSVKTKAVKQLKRVKELHIDTGKKVQKDMEKSLDKLEKEVIEVIKRLEKTNDSRAKKRLVGQAIEKTLVLGARSVESIEPHMDVNQTLSNLPDRMSVAATGVEGAEVAVGSMVLVLQGLQIAGKKKFISFLEKEIENLGKKRRGNKVDNNLTVAIEKKKKELNKLKREVLASEKQLKVSIGRSGVGAGAAVFEGISGFAPHAAHVFPIVAHALVGVGGVFGMVVGAISLKDVINNIKNLSAEKKKVAEKLKAFKESNLNKMDPRYVLLDLKLMHLNKVKLAGELSNLMKAALGLAGSTGAASSGAALIAHAKAAVTLALGKASFGVALPAAALAGAVFFMNERSVFLRSKERSRLMKEAVTIEKKLQLAEKKLDDLANISDTNTFLAKKKSELAKMHEDVHKLVNIWNEIEDKRDHLHRKKVPLNDYRLDSLESQRREVDRRLQKIGKQRRKIVAMINNFRKYLKEKQARFYDKKEQLLTLKQKKVARIQKIDRQRQKKRMADVMGVSPQVFKKFKESLDGLLKEGKKHREELINLVAEMKGVDTTELKDETSDKVLEWLFG